MDHPRIGGPARKHGVEDADMLHAFRNPIRLYDMDDGLTMWVGPGLDGRLLEVGVVDSTDGPVAIHAMARSTEVPSPEVRNMPRSMQEIIDQADELARRFEDYEPRDDDERPAESVALLRDAAVRRADGEREVAEAVMYARKDGLSWAAIGGVLGTSGEAARQRYGKPAAH